MDYVWGRIGELDRRVAERKPFELVKTDAEKGREIITELAGGLYSIARMLNPFMPATSEQIKSAIKANKKPENLFARKD